MCRIYILYDNYFWSTQSDRINLEMSTIGIAPPLSKSTCDAYAVTVEPS
jgi:hypothetical protein